MLMLKKDFEAFKENYECVSLEKGVYNIWLKHKSNKYGFKFFFICLWHKYLLQEIT